MPVATTAILAATAIGGVALSGYGMYEQQQGRNAQVAGAQQQAAGARVQALAAQQASEGAQRQVEGAIVQNQANKTIIGLEQQTDEQRRLAMELDARRSMRQTIRQAQVARAQGLAAATNQGAQFGSGLQGGYGQVSGDMNTSLLGIGQNLAIGRAIFGINSQIGQQKLAVAGGQDIINEGSGIIARSQGLAAQGAGIIAQAGGTIAAGAGQAAMGAGLTSLGSMITQNAGTIANVGTYGLNSIGSAFGSGTTNQQLGNGYFVQRNGLGFY